MLLKTKDGCEKLLGLALIYVKTKEIVGWLRNQGVEFPYHSCEFFVPVARTTDRVKTLRGVQQRDGHPLKRRVGPGVGVSWRFQASAISFVNKPLA
jgi:hypothetical protein